MNAQAGNRRALLGPALVVAVLAGCGGGSSGGPETAAAPAPKPCHAGKSILAHVPEAPEAWSSGPRPAIALTCSGDRVDDGAAIAGYPVPGGGSCVSAYSARLREAFGELCELPGSAWLSQCEGRACVHYFRHAKSYTVLDGPADPATEGIRIAAGGKTLLEGVMHADVSGATMQAIGAEERFDFFAAYIPRCVDPDEVEVKLIAADGSVLGTADEWDVPVPSCRRSS